MMRLACAVAPLVLIQLSSACSAGDSTPEGDSGASDSTTNGDAYASGDLLAGDHGPCPPTIGFGTDVGDVMPSIALEDCDGNLHELNELCSREAGWIFVYAGW